MSSHNHPNYFKIYLLLLVLFVISVLGPELAHWLDMEGPSRLILVLVTAFGIALVKAYYVLAYFMHLKFEKIYAPYILLSMVSLLFVFYFGTATDAGKSEGHNWVKHYVEPEVAAGEGGHGEHDANSEGESHEAADHGDQTH